MAQSKEFIQPVTNDHPACPHRTVSIPPKWRFGDPPNYKLVNEKYLKQKTNTNEPGSLEKIVENLVKSWEVEFAHKPDAQTWDTITDDFVINANDGEFFDTERAGQTGNYAALLDSCPRFTITLKSKSPTEIDNYFREQMKTGFAWELLKVYEGPPNVAFSWRHWGHLGATSPENEETQGSLVELFGYSIAEVDENLKIKKIENYFDGERFLEVVQGSRKEKVDIKIEIPSKILLAKIHEVKQAASQVTEPEQGVQKQPEIGGDVEVEDASGSQSCSCFFN